MRPAAVLSYQSERDTTVGAYEWLKLVQHCINNHGMKQLITEIIMRIRFVHSRDL